MILGQSEKTSKQLIVEALYLDLEDFKQSESGGKKTGKKGERERYVIFMVVYKCVCFKENLCDLNHMSKCHFLYMTQCQKVRMQGVMHFS